MCAPSRSLPLQDTAAGFMVNDDPSPHR